jgi:hypothetical protein
MFECDLTTPGLALMRLVASLDIDVAGSYSYVTLNNLGAALRDA